MCFTLILWFLLLFFLCLVFDDYDEAALPPGVPCSRSQHVDQYHYSRNMVTCLNTDYNIVRHAVLKLTFGQIKLSPRWSSQLDCDIHILFFSWGVHELEKRLRPVKSNDSQVFTSTKFSILLEHKLQNFERRLTNFDTWSDLLSCPIQGAVRCPIWKTIVPITGTSFIIVNAMLPLSMIFNFDMSKIADLIIINTVSQSGNLPQMFWRSDVHSSSHESSPM